ncbi:MAG: amino acid transporter, partial [Sulfurimonas sp.]
KTIEANRFVLLVSSTFSALALLTLLYHTYSSNPNAIMIFMSFIITSMLFELIYGRYVRGEIFSRKYHIKK